MQTNINHILVFLPAGAYSSNFGLRQKCKTVCENDDRCNYYTIKNAYLMGNGKANGDCRCELFDACVMKDSNTSTFTGDTQRCVEEAGCSGTGKFISGGEFIGMYDKITIDWCEQNAVDNTGFNVYDTDRKTCTMYKTCVNTKKCPRADNLQIKSYISGGGCSIL